MKKNKKSRLRALARTRAKNPKITILFWVLVIGFLNLVSVDAKERSKMS